MDNVASGKARAKRGPPPTPGTVPHEHKRWVQAVAASAKGRAGKKQRLLRDAAVAQAAGVGWGDRGKSGAAQLVAAGGGVGAATVEKDH